MRGRSKKKEWAYICTVVAVILFLSFCCQDDGGEAMGRLLNHGECKGQNQIQNTRTFQNGEVKDCIQYSYDGISQLKLTHIDAYFNCCPGKITAEIIIEDNRITILEKEEMAGCHCMCYFDLDYEFNQVKPGIYTISINNTLEWTIDLSSSPSGRLCTQDM